LFDEFNIEIFQENIKRVLKEEGFEVVVDCLQKKELVLAEKLLQKKQPA